MRPDLDVKLTSEPETITVVAKTLYGKQSVELATIGYVENFSVKTLSTTTDLSNKRGADLRPSWFLVITGGMNSSSGFLSPQTPQPHHATGPEIRASLAQTLLSLETILSTMCSLDTQLPPILQFPTSRGFISAIVVGV